MDELGNDMDSTASRLDVVQVHSLLHYEFILPNVLCNSMSNVGIDQFVLNYL